jgi:exopolyphosphatase/guanosine-5'-triphosphate,3'-diphosphate pyrophosphatase
LSGDQEALLTFRGVSAGREVSAGTVVLDVGGGSTELILGGPEGVSFHTSLDLGCVRLTERYGTDFEATASHVRDVLVERLPVDLGPTGAIGVAGTITTLATLDLGLDEEDPELVHGHRLSAETIAAQTDRLEGMTVEDIRALRGMHPDRAPVIAAGAVVVRETLTHFGLKALEVSEHDIMHGAALAAAKMPEEAEPGAPPSAHTCC